MPVGKKPTQSYQAVINISHGRKVGESGGVPIMEADLVLRGEFLDLTDEEAEHFGSWVRPADKSNEPLPRKAPRDVLPSKQRTGPPPNETEALDVKDESHVLRSDDPQPTDNPVDPSYKATRGKDVK